MIEYGTRYDQLTGRIMLYGMESLSDVEQVEFHLYYYRPKKGMDVHALAERMVEKYGGMAELAFLTVNELMEVKGMYRALAQRFTNYGELLKKFAQYERIYQKTYIRNITDLCRFALPLYRECQLPGTWQLCLNEGYELIYYREITPSLAWGEEDSMEKSLHDMEFSSAKYSIIVQMRGREFADPKPYDKKHAKLLAERLRQINCHLLDVVMIDEGKLTSMHELGMIKHNFFDGDKPIDFDAEKYFEMMRNRK